MVKNIFASDKIKTSGWIATVILKSNGTYTNDERLDVLSQAVDSIARETEGDGVVLFPCGWFKTDNDEARTLYNWVEEKVKDIICESKRNIIVCLGIDGRISQYIKGLPVASDQIAIAISDKGIEALGRKFYPASPEAGLIELANNHVVKEDGKSREFELHGKRYFLCVCYDIFGINHKEIANPGMDIILNLIHGFTPKGQGSGDIDFARKGMAGASRQWNCSVYGAAVFFNREIPTNWPSGIYWNQGDKSTKNWKYTDNPLDPEKTWILGTKEGIAQVRIFYFGLV